MCFVFWYFGSILQFLCWKFEDCAARYNGQFHFATSADTTYQSNTTAAWTACKAGTELKMDVIIASEIVKMLNSQSRTWELQMGKRRTIAHGLQQRAAPINLHAIIVIIVRWGVRIVFDIVVPLVPDRQWHPVLAVCGGLWWGCEATDEESWRSWSFSRFHRVLCTFLHALPQVSYVSKSLFVGILWAQWSKGRFEEGILVFHDARNPTHNEWCKEPYSYVAPGNTESKAEQSGAYWSWSMKNLAWLRRGLYSQLCRRGAFPAVSKRNFASTF